MGFLSPDLGLFFAFGLRTKERVAQVCLVGSIVLGSYLCFPRSQPLLLVCLCTHLGKVAKDIQLVSLQGSRQLQDQD
jgi:hypothetical protein